LLNKIEKKINRTGNRQCLFMYMISLVIFNTTFILYFVFKLYTRAFFYVLDNVYSVSLYVLVLFIKSTDFTTFSLSYLMIIFFTSKL